MTHNDNERISAVILIDQKMFLHMALLALHGPLLSAAGGYSSILNILPYLLLQQGLNPILLPDDFICTESQKGIEEFWS